MSSTVTRTPAKSSKTRPQGVLTKTHLSWKISDHYPLWVEFSV
jgi:endonuclease/exonuclease/phosphatase family metal-dependent hydrolase